jgi:hypothetical protein
MGLWAKENGQMFLRCFPEECRNYDDIHFGRFASATTIVELSGVTGVHLYPGF